MKRGRSWSLVLVLALVLGLLVVALGPVWAGGAGDPDPGTVVGIRTVEFAAGTVGITTTSYYDDSTGYDTRWWQSADVFVTADVQDTNTITITPQWSADATNWVDAKYKAEGWVLPLDYSVTITNSSGVTNTTTTSSTHEFAGTTGTRVSEWVTYQMALTADGSDLLAIPLRGNYLRLKAEVLTTTYRITPTISVVLRNDGGR